MKKIQTLVTVIISLIFLSCSAQNKGNEKETNQSISKIEVIDFHSTHRCMTCNAIEANTKYTLETYFPKELKSSKISFKTINVDEEENEKVAENFEAYGTALFLNVIKKGKETHIDLTDFAFMKGNEKEAFSNELKAKITSELKSL